MGHRLPSPGPGLLHLPGSALHRSVTSGRSRSVGLSSSLTGPLVLNVNWASGRNGGSPTLTIHHLGVVTEVA